MTAETAFRSDERFDQKAFRQWLRGRPGSDINHYELIDGKIVMTPPAGWPHASVGAMILSSLNNHVRSHKLGIVLDSSAGYELPSGDTVEPDVSYISTKRFAAGPKPSAGRFVRIVPDLIVEILSPSTSRRDRTEKKELYQRNAVQEYWIVDPSGKHVTVYRLGKRGYGPGSAISAGRIRSRLLPGLELSVKDLFES